MLGESAGRSAGNEPRLEALRRFEMDERAQAVGIPEEQALEAQPRAVRVTRVLIHVLMFAFTMVVCVAFGGFAGLAMFAVGAAGGASATLLVLSHQQLRSVRRS